MKAFLSHSSSDKEFVSAVAQELGRQFCLFDAFAFASGDEFKASIERGLDESSVFVLFASSAALRSLWVNFEVEEAWRRRLEAKIPTAVVYLLGTDIGVADLPPWLQRALARRENAYKMVARDIRHHLNELLKQRHQVFFVGRSEELQALEEALVPIDGRPSPRSLFVTGLPGIGRRSLVGQSIPRTLNLRKMVDIPIGEGDSINDIAIRLADQAEPHTTKESFERAFALISDLTEDQALKRALANLRKMTAGSELPILYDRGGLLDSEGSLRRPVASLLDALEQDGNAYAILVSHRRPSREVAVPGIHLRPLERNDTMRLLTLQAKQAGINISPAQIGELAGHIAGYPPAAEFAIKHAKLYGVAVLISDKSRLVQYRIDPILKHLLSLQFDDEEQALLRILATYSPLRLTVLGKGIGQTARPLTEKVIRLIDLALVVVTESGSYAIAAPVGEPVQHAFGTPTEKEHIRIAEALDEALTSSEGEGHWLELYRLRFLAANLSETLAEEPKLLRMASDLIETVEKLYHDQRYDDAIKVARVALRERPGSETARGFLIRALIKQEQWDEAESQLFEMSRHVPPRDVCFLRGFLERNRGKFAEAIDAYNEAKQRGRRGAAIGRELAHCYLHSGELEKAREEIQSVVKTHSNNEFVLDLMVQIAMRQGDESSAREALEGFKAVTSKQMWYLHRLARLEWAFGHPAAALVAARQAAESDPNPPFEVLAQLAHGEIESGDIDVAEKLLRRLDASFPKIRRDIRAGLQCRLEIRRGRFAAALAQSGRITDHSTVEYKLIRRDALEGELRDAVLSDRVRKLYQEELDQLEAERSSGRMAGKGRLGLDSLGRFETRDID